MGRAGAVARLSWTSGPIPSRRSRKRRAVRALRAQGLYGPRLRDVLPAFAGVVAAVCAVAALLAAGYRAAGIVVPVAGVAFLTLVVTAAIRHGRPGARRRIGYYTEDELLELDTQGLALAVARMLRRDGWRVRLMPAPDRPRLCARDAVEPSDRRGLPSGGGTPPRRGRAASSPAPRGPGISPAPGRPPRCLHRPRHPLGSPGEDDLPARRVRSAAVGGGRTTQRRAVAGAMTGSRYAPAAKERRRVGLSPVRSARRSSG